MPADGGKHREPGGHEGASGPRVGGDAWAQDGDQEPVQELPAHLCRPEGPQRVQGEDPTDGGRYSPFLFVCCRLWCCQFLLYGVKQKNVLRAATVVYNNILAKLHPALGWNYIIQIFAWNSCWQDSGFVQSDSVGL